MWPRIPRPPSLRGFRRRGRIFFPQRHHYYDAHIDTFINASILRNIPLRGIKKKSRPGHQKVTQRHWLGLYFRRHKRFKGRRVPRWRAGPISVKPQWKQDNASRKRSHRGMPNKSRFRDDDNFRSRRGRRSRIMDRRLRRVGSGGKGKSRGRKTSGSTIT